MRFDHYTERMKVLIYRKNDAYWNFGNYLSQSAIKYYAVITYHFTVFRAIT